MSPKRSVAAALVMALAVGGVVAAQPAPEAGSALTGEVRLAGLLYENLFQAPLGEPEQDVNAIRAEGRFRWRWNPDGSWFLDGTASATEYDSGLDPSQGISLGLVRQGRHGVELELEHANDRPSVETDVFDQADVTRLTGRYVLRPDRDWQFAVTAFVERQSYARALDRDNDAQSIGGAVRYRGFGRGFSPEIGLSVSERDVDDTSGSHDQNEYFVRVVSAPVEPLYLSLRYRLRKRDYTTLDPQASNRGRRDDRAQWALTGVWRLTDRWALDLYLTREESDSTREEVEFRTSVAMLGVSWRFGEPRR